MFDLIILANTMNNLVDNENSNFLLQTNDGITLEIFLFGIAIILILFLIFNKRKDKKNDI